MHHFDGFRGSSMASPSAQNALEVQDYMKDLFDWQKDIKKKDKGIRKHAGEDRNSALSATPPTAPLSSNAASSVLPSQAISSSLDSSLPAPRGRAVTSKVSVAPSALQAPGILPSTMQPRQSGTASGIPTHGSSTIVGEGAQTMQKPKRRRRKVKGPPLPDGAVRLGSTAASHTYAAYQKWDKFDVDAALESDNEPSEYETDSEFEMEPPSAAISAPATSATSVPAASSHPPDRTSPATPNASIAIAPREPLTSSDLSERSTTRTAPPPTSAASSAAASEPPASSSSSERDLPPIRSQEPQTSEAWRARGNDLFKVCLLLLASVMVLQVSFIYFIQILTLKMCDR